MKKLLFLLLIISYICTIAACGAFADPPSLDKAQDFFQEHYDDICTIKDFLTEVDGLFHLDCYENYVYIWDQKTAPDDIVSCVKRLRNASGQTRLFIGKFHDTINISFWHPIGRDISSGFAYSMDSDKLPEIGYATSIDPLSESDWYYYVDDFNTWRANQRTTGDSSPSTT